MDCPAYCKYLKSKYYVYIYIYVYISLAEWKENMKVQHKLWRNIVKESKIIVFLFLDIVTLHSGKMIYRLAYFIFWDAWINLKGERADEFKEWLI